MGFLPQLMVAALLSAGPPLPDPWPTQAGVHGRSTAATTKGRLGAGGWRPEARGYSAWLRLDLGELSLHYPAELQTTAERVAVVAPRVLREQRSRLGARAAGPIHLVLDEEPASPFTVKPCSQGCVRLGVVPDDDPLRGPEDPVAAQVARALALTQVLQVLGGRSGAKMRLGVLVTPEGGLLRPDRSLGLDIGFGSSEGPDWFLLGAAEQLAAGAGGQAWGASRDMVLRTLLLDGASTTDGALSGPYWSPERAASLGHSLARQLARQHGQDLFSELLLSLPAPAGSVLQIEPGIADRLAELGGTDASRMWASWREETQARYREQIEARGPLLEGQSLEAPSPGSPEGYRSLAVDAKSRWLGLSDGEDLYVARLHWPTVNRGQQSLPPTPGEWTRIPDAGGGFCFSSDGGSVVVSSPRCLGSLQDCLILRPERTHELYRVSLASGEALQLTRWLRVVEPACSPVSSELAFVQRLGLRSALGISDLGDPGKGIRWLLRREDGGHIQDPTFSPDGERIIFSMLRDGRQELWSLRGDGGGLVPLTWSPEQERGPVFDPGSGSLCYSANPEGVFDILCRPLQPGPVRRRTRVRSGAVSPAPLDDGSLLYLRYTPRGFMPHWVPASRGLTQGPVPRSPAPLAVARYLARPDALPPSLPRPRQEGLLDALAPPLLVPLLYIDQAAPSAGLSAKLGDLGNAHRLRAGVLLGSATLLALRYGFLGLGPEAYLEGSLLRTTPLIAKEIDPDADSRTPEPSLVQTLKSMEQTMDLGMGVGLAAAPGLHLGLGLRYRDMHRYLPDAGASGALLFRWYAPWWSLELGSIGATRPSRHKAPLEPPSGRRLRFSHHYIMSSIPEQFDDVELIGRRDPGGEWYDQTYHRLEADYLESLRLPELWGLRQGLSLGLGLGWISRNVSPEEELHAGGHHPLRHIERDRLARRFYGYGPYALRGETLVLLRAAYRVALARHMGWGWGPFGIHCVWLGVGGTLGNLWGYDGEPRRYADGTVATYPRDRSVPAPLRGQVQYLPGSLHGELPLRDEASSNGNLLLADAHLDLVVSTSLRRSPWLWTLRLAWGFMSLEGPGDLDGDGRVSQGFPSDPLRDERVPPGLRLMLMVGGGWPEGA